MRRKGQFMLISAVVIGIIIMTLAGSISRISSQEFNPDSAKYTINMIENEAEKLDLSEREDRARFRRTLNLIDSYRIETSYPQSGSCINVTLIDRSQQFNLECVGEN